ncbi:podocan-like protein 1 isoform X1 [Clavelina lepadiformis]|uniref:podocan-like protein 1 isoform X1 n=1 Tax=Clavelina lepadiformis TaxID=159417 RepID=UPI0040419304
MKMQFALQVFMTGTILLAASAVMSVRGSNGGVLVSQIVEKEQLCIYNDCSCALLNTTGIFEVHIDCSGKSLRSLNFFETVSLRNIILHSSTRQSEDTRHRRYEQKRVRLVTEAEDRYLIALNLRMNSLARIDNEFQEFGEEAQYVHMLDLSYNKIHHINFDAFSALVSLEVLLLKYNPIRTIPDLSHLANLKTLGLEKNYFLKQLPGTQLPKQLNKLLLSGVPLKSINRELLQGQTELKELDLSNGFDTSPRRRSLELDAFDNLQNLTILKISHTRWQANMAPLQQLKHLKVLKARRCYLKSMLPIIDEQTNMAYSSQLEQLDISGNRFNAQSLTTTNIPSLRKLYLSYTSIPELPQIAFQGMPKLIELHISGIRLRNKNITVLKNSESLQNLDISHNKLRELMPISAQLEQINLKGNKLQRIDRKTFSRANSLRHLDLSYQKITSIDAYAFYDVTNPKALKWVNLKGNKLRVLQRNMMLGLDNLIELNLEENHLQTLGPLDLPSLKVLRLSHNRLIRLDERTFTGLPSLQQLNISNNELLEFNAELPELQHLDLKSNNLTVIPNISRMTELTTLLLDYNFIKEVSYGALPTHTIALNTLKLSNNKLKMLEPGCFQGLVNLTKLDLSWEAYESEKENSFSMMAIADLVKLEELDLHHNSIKHFINFTLPNLKRLNLYQNQLKTLGNIPLRELFPRIEDIDLAVNQVNYIRPGLLDGQTHLKRLDLKQNHFDCPCADNENNQHFKSYQYVKEWLIDFSYSDQVDPHMAREIQVDEKNEMPLYSCIKTSREIVAFFSNPCQEESILSSLLSGMALTEYKEYLETLEASADENLPGVNYDSDYYENYYGI